jgi:hypothetical protein
MPVSVEGLERLRAQRDHGFDSLGFDTAADQAEQFRHMVLFETAVWLLRLFRLF